MTPDAVLEAHGLSKAFRGFVALKQVDLSVRPGTIHALIGPNGAGKSTLFNLLTKFLTPTSGTIRFKGRDITHMKPADISRMGMVRSSQISSVFPHLTVHENVRVALQTRTREVFDFWKPESRLERLNQRVDALLDRVGLAGSARQLAAELPYGSKRALELATTLALDPEVMLLDEPMAGMGREDICRTADLIRELARDRTILMVEHNLRVVADISHTITVLSRGEVIAEGCYADVAANREVREACMGTAHA